VTKIYLCGITGTPEQKGLLKVSLGAEKFVPWEYTKNTWQVIDKLKKQGIQIISLELNGTSRDIKKYKPQFPCALVVGNEVTGVSASALSRSDTIVHIPMIGTKESFNVSVAFGIAAYMIQK
jgi:tRNA G18 (ribose-2'-O)-methylase SpoU